MPQSVHWSDVCTFFAQHHTVFLAWIHSLSWFEDLRSSEKTLSLLKATGSLCAARLWTLLLSPGVLDAQAVTELSR